MVLERLNLDGQASLKMKMNFNCEMWLFNGALASHTQPSRTSHCFCPVNAGTDSQFLLVSVRKHRFSCRVQLTELDPEEGALDKCIQMCLFKPL